MSISYQLELDKVLESIAPRGGKLMLHACCGPCASYVVEYLSRHMDIAVLFYNPNIQPEEEYYKRLGSMKRLLDKLVTPRTVTLIEDGYHAEDYTDIWQRLKGEREGGLRCYECIGLRLAKTALLAARLGYPYFCSTLTVSPHKNAEMINDIGQRLAAETGVVWLPSDFKKRNGYARSIEMSRAFDLYRQNYCGCDKSF